MPTETLYQWDSQASADADETHQAAAFHEFERIAEYADTAAEDF